jgi:hypothetical protein
MSKIYFCPGTTDLAEIFRRCVPEPRKLIIKISAQNIELFKSYPYNKGQKVGPPSVTDFSPKFNHTDLWLASKCS